jgi:hypothetical protein
MKYVLIITFVPSFQMYCERFICPMLLNHITTFIGNLSSNLIIKNLSINILKAVSVETKFMYW